MMTCSAGSISKTIDRCKSIIDARVKPAHDVGEYFDNKSFRDGAAGPGIQTAFHMTQSCSTLVAGIHVFTTWR